MVIRIRVYNKLRLRHVPWTWPWNLKRSSWQSLKRLRTQNPISLFVAGPVCFWSDRQQLFPDFESLVRSSRRLGTPSIFLKMILGMRTIVQIILYTLHDDKSFSTRLVQDIFTLQSIQRNFRILET